MRDTERLAATRRQAEFHLAEALRLAVELARPQVVQVVQRTTLPDALENRAVEQEARAVEYEAAAATEPDAGEVAWLDAAAARCRAVVATLRARAAEARTQLGEAGDA